MWVAPMQVSCTFQPVLDMIAEKVFLLDHYMLLSVVVLIAVIMLSLAMKSAQSFKFVRPTGIFKRLFSSVPSGTEVVDKQPTFEEKMKVARERQWDIKGLKVEVSRLYLRSMKKVEKCNERIMKGGSGEDLHALSKRVMLLKELEESLSDLKSTKDGKFVELLPTIVDLDVSDVIPSRPPPAPKKAKIPPTGPRKPYFVYKSKDNIEIFVGRAAEDNDKLSCDPSLREENDWWLHVAGYPGSHVVIRCTDDNLPELYPETLQDAVALAAANSKFEPKNRVQVTLTRVRYVKKPAGAKPGLVHIIGRDDHIRILKINLNNEVERFDRLTKSKTG
jgi:hypothetical protein